MSVPQIVFFLLTTLTVRFLHGVEPCCKWIPIQEKSNPTQEKIVAYGQIVDETEEPISPASVFLVSPKPWQIRNFDIHSKSSVLKTTTDQDGQFRILVDQKDDLFFLNGKASIVVIKDGMQIGIRSFSMKRLRIDLPFQIEMKPLVKQKIKVVDHFGARVQNAVVRPAFSATDFLRRSAEIPSLELKSDKNGFVVPENYSPYQSQFYYIQSQSHGNQFLKAQAEQVNNDQIVWKLKLKPRRNLFGQIVLPKGIPHSQIRGTRIHINGFDEKSELLCEQSWNEVIVDKDGRFDCPNLFGKFNRIAVITSNNLLPIESEFAASNTRVQHRQRIPFGESKSYRVRVLNELGQPISRAEGRFSVPLKSLQTDQSGLLNFDLPKSKHPSGYFFVFDPSQKYTRSKKREGRLERLFTGGKAIPSITLSRSGDIKGQVLNPSSKPVSGAEIQFQWKSGHSIHRDQTVANKKGEFHISGIPNNSKIDLSASSGGFFANTTVQMKSDNSNIDDLRIELKPRPIYIPFGRLIDQHGNPAPYVPFSVSDVTSYRKEGYQSEYKQYQPRYLSQSIFVTDQDGVFYLPPTSDIHSSIAISVRDGRYFPYSSGEIQLEDRAQNGEIILGDLKLERHPKVQNLPVVIKDTNGSEVNRAKLLVFNYSFPTREFHYTPKQKSSFSIQVPDSGFLLAIKADGYASQFHWIEPSKTKLITLNLQPQNVPNIQNQENRVVFKRGTPSAIQNGLKRLLSDLPLPSPGGATYSRNLLFHKLQSITNPVRCIEFAESGYKRFPDGISIVQSISDQIDDLSHSTFNRFASSQDNPTHFYLSAIRTDDPVVRMERFAEAIIAVKKINGYGRLEYQLQLAFLLLLDGHQEAAESLARSAWQRKEASYWKEILKKNQRQSNLHFNISAVPSLYMIDPEVGRRLEILTAMESINPRNFHSPISMTALYLSNPEKFRSFIKKYPKKIGGTDLLLNYFAMMSKKRLSKYRDLFKVLANHTSSPIEKYRYYLLASDAVTEPAEKEELLKLALQTSRACSNSIGDNSLGFNGMLIETERCRCLTKKHYNDILFEMLKNGRTGFIGRNRQYVFSDLAILVGMEYPNLAKNLLTPSLKDQSRTFAGNKLLNLNLLPQTVAAMKIDIDWGVQAVQQLTAKYGSKDSGAQYQLREAIGRKLGELTNQK